MQGNADYLCLKLWLYYSKLGSDNREAAAGL